MGGFTLRGFTLGFTLAVAGALAPAAVAQAAGDIKVVDQGPNKEIVYSGTAAADIVTFGGDSSVGLVTVKQDGIQDPPASSDPNDICTPVAVDVLACSDPELNAISGGRATAIMYDGNDKVTVTGTLDWSINGDGGDDTLISGDQTRDMLTGGPGDDVLETHGSTATGDFSAEYVAGEEGDDVLRGGPQMDHLHGGAGNDTLEGGGGQDGLTGDVGTDILRGGAGDDNLSGGPGPGDVAEGGEGTDWFDCEGDAGETYDGGPGADGIDCYGGVVVDGVYTPDSFAIDLPAGTVRRLSRTPTSSVIRGVEDVSTSVGNDVVVGDGGANLIDTGRGDDTIDARGGADHVRANAGRDTIELGDGAGDRADAGMDADTCHADAFDELFACESAVIAPLPVAPAPRSGDAPADRTAPACTITRPRATRARVTFTATCDEPATLSATVAGRLTRLSRHAIGARIGDVTLGSATATAPSGTAVNVRVNVARRYRKALARRGRLRVELHATDAAGNDRVITRMARLR
jgi:Ca2+-binding RTX toxin-like protein